MRYVEHRPMSDASTPRLTARDLSLARGDRAILRGVSLELRASRIVSIEGPSGSGKSTLLRVLAAQETADEGALALDGIDAGSLSPREYRRRVALVFQEPVMLDGTVSDNIAKGPSLRGETLAPARIEELLGSVDLSGFGPRDARTLSGGEKQRVALARALANEPSVMLLDEPTSALDEVSAALVLDRIVAIARSGIAVAMVTHSSEQAARIATYRLRFANGTLTEDASR
jgi:putative ABC transport system ATP-binding protein